MSSLRSLAFLGHRSVRFVARPGPIAALGALAFCVACQSGGSTDNQSEPALSASEPTASPDGSPGPTLSDTTAGPTSGSPTVPGPSASPPGSGGATPSPSGPNVNPGAGAGPGPAPVGGGPSDPNPAGAGGDPAQGSAPSDGGSPIASGGSTAGASAGGSPSGGAGGSQTPDASGANFPFPLNVRSEYCTYPTNADPDAVRAAYEDWKETTVTSEGASGFLRVKKPDSGNVIGSTVSEGMGYGMLLTVYMNDQEVFDNLWKYVLVYLNGNGLMNWEIDPNGGVIGSGAASDGDEDMAFALIMADRQWGGQGNLDKSYLEYAVELINAMWDHEVDHGRNDMLKAGDTWGDVDITNPSYFAPAYYRVFGKVTGNEAGWNRVVESSYDIIEASLNAANGNQDNGLVPAWCTSAGVPTEAYAGAPTHFQQDSTRTPFRVGQDYCYFGEPRAKAYLEKITSFYRGVGVENIVDGYELDGTPRPERATNGLQTASFVGPAGVGAMNDAMNQAFVDEAYAAVATLELTAGTIYYQKSWTALSLLMLTGNFVDLTSM